MEKSSIYRVWVESSVGGSQWRGTFSERPGTSDILLAIGLDIEDLNPTVEHEADRIREYQRLQEVVYHSDRLKTDVVEVTVADVKLGEIRIAEEKIFVK